MKNMSQMIPIRNLGSQGVISDIGSYDLQTNQIAEGLNLRVKSGYVQSSYGWQPYISTENSRFIAPWWNRLYNSIIEVRNDKIIWHRALTDQVDVTPVDGINDSFDWQAEQHGEWIILTNSGSDIPIVMSPTDTQFVKLSKFPTDELVGGITSFQGFLVAWDIQIGVEDNPYLIHWSDVLAPNNIDPSWDFADPITLSGTNELAGGKGAILRCEALADRLYIYQQFGVSMAYTTGDLYVFGFKDLFSDDGLINSNAVAEFNGKHFCVGQHSIYTHNGNTKQPIAEKRVERVFFDSLKNPDSVKVIHYPNFDEIWVLYSDDTASINATKVLVYNYNYDAYTFRQLPQNTLNVIRAPKALTTSDVWESENEKWEETTKLWQKADAEENETILLYHCANDNEIFRGDFGLLGNGAEIPSYIQQSKIDMEEITGNSTDVKMLTAIYPQISGAGIVRISIGGADRPNGAIKFDYVQDFNINQDTKVDCLVSYRYLAIKYEIIGVGSFNISGHDLELKVRSRK